MDFIIKQLDESFKPKVLELIAEDALRPEGILEKDSKYWGAFWEEELIGVIGCEIENQYGILRSALVHKKFRKKGIAEKLNGVLLQNAREDKLKAIYLFSTEAGAYWTRLGFTGTTVQEVLEKLPDSYQVKLFEKLGWLSTEIAFKYCLTD